MIGDDEVELVIEDDIQGFDLHWAAIAFEDIVDAFFSSRQFVPDSWVHKNGGGVIRRIDLRIPCFLVLDTRFPAGMTSYLDIFAYNDERFRSGPALW
jgi:hypothetical protein